MYIGIDLGTSSVKLLLMNRDGQVINTTNREYPLYFPRSSWAEQNPIDWYNAVLSGLEELISNEERHHIQSISFSGQMHGLVILNERDEVIRPAILWNDQRTSQECDYLNQVITRERIAKYTGNIALTGFTAPKLMWLKTNEPDNFYQVSKIMLPKDYISYQLTGVFATDVSDASGTLYFDVEKRTWSQEMLDILTIKRSQLPTIYESYDIIGTLKLELANRLGLSENVKVIIGGGDQAVAAIGTGTVENTCSLSLGTSGVIFVPSTNFIYDEHYTLHSFCHANGKYHLMGVMLSAAAALKWWNENILYNQDYSQLLDDAAKIGADQDLYFLPYLMGERTPINDPHSRGTFIGLSLDHNRANMTRAVLEGVAFALRDSFENIKNLGIKIDKIRVTGGGTKSRLWLEILANVLGTPLETINTTDASALGAAILAAVGVGDYTSILDATNNIIKVTNTININKEDVEIYNSKYKKFSEIYPSLKSFFSKIY